MKKLKDILRTLIPQAFLNAYRERKKEQVRRELHKKKKQGDVITKTILVNQLEAAGIQKGDTLLVHSAMSKLGYLENGPQTLVDALIEVVGENGNILIPTSPSASYQIEYAQNNPVFDVLHSPSRLGAITEYFRKIPGVKRSLHPTEPVAVYGPDAEWLTEGHFGQLTPYNSQSPFFRIYQKNAKILYIGVTLENAGTSLHTLEDAVDFKYPVYLDGFYPFTVIDENGARHEVKTRIHNPDFSRRRNCDVLLPIFEGEGIARKTKIGEADTWIFFSKPFFESIVRHYHEDGITVYTPHGEKIEGYD